MSDGQLELFDLASSSAPRPHRETLGRLLFNLRYDHLALASIAVLLTITVVFACGVERGKHLAKAERLWDRDAASASAPARIAESSKRTAEIPAAAPTAAMVKPAVPKAPATDKRPATTRSRYAVQVRTYSESKLAKLEMDRLRAKGESAFLVMRDGRTFVYVGPFPTRNGATEKVVGLRTRYQDCFVKTL